MEKKIRKLLNKETILYVVFGILTTVVNYVVFLLCYNVLFNDKGSLYANVIAFVVAVLFAFIVNKLFVFESKSWSLSVLKKEIPAFLAARIGSFLIEEFGLFVAEKILKLNNFEICKIGDTVIDGVVAAKLVLAVIVVLLNYIFCKFIVFKSPNSK